LPPFEITEPASDGEFPTIDVAPNGRSVMVGYVKVLASTKTPFFRESNNNATSWSSPGAIWNHSISEDAVFVDIAYDSNNQAHAVWTAETEVNALKHKIFYAKENSWPASPSYFSFAPNTGIITNPNIHINGDDIFIVWAEHDTLVEQSDIYYRVSTNGGSSWSANTLVSQSNTRLLRPEIHYRRGTLQGNTISWDSSSITISDINNPARPINPKLMVDGNRVNVTYTSWEGISQQYIHHLSCNSQCTSLLSWSSSPVPISGQALGQRNVAPFYVKSTMTQVKGCTYVYFHGIPVSANNEQIFGVNSCGNWANSGRDVVTPQSKASFNVEMASHNDWYIYLTYQDEASDGTDTIWFIRNDPAIYLPAILK
jgi:hypothetical protein